MKKKKIKKLPKNNGKPFKKTKKADLTISLKDLENTLGNCLIIAGDEVIYSPKADNFSNRLKELREKENCEVIDLDYTDVISKRLEP